MSNLICGKSAVGGNYNSTRDRESFIPYCQDKVFIGWNTEADGSGQWITPDTIVNTSGTHTLYAQYTSTSVASIDVAYSSYATDNGKVQDWNIVDNDVYSYSNGIFTFEKPCQIQIDYSLRLECTDRLAESILGLYCKDGMRVGLWKEYGMSAGNIKQDTNTLVINVESGDILYIDCFCDSKNNTSGKEKVHITCDIKVVGKMEK